MAFFCVKRKTIHFRHKMWRCLVFVKESGEKKNDLNICNGLGRLVQRHSASPNSLCISSMATLRPSEYVITHYSQTICIHVRDFEMYLAMKNSFSMLFGLLTKISYMDRLSWIPIDF